MVDIGLQPSGSVATPAPGGGGRNFYVGVSGMCPPASGNYTTGTGGAYPALNGGACLASLNDVPWGEAGGGNTRLAPGDTVYVSRDASPYNMRFQVSGQGTATQWIRVLGMLGPGGERPIINGIGATTAHFSNFYWPSTDPNIGIQGGGVVFVGPALGDTATPKYIEVANLHIRGQRPAYTYTSENGEVANYGTFGAAIYARSPQHLLVRNCVLTDSTEGFYNWTGPDDDTPYGGVAKDITLRGNVIYDVGVPGLERRHATYTEALGMVYEFNYFGPMTSGATGNQLRDRSAGTIVRYNWIEAPAGPAYHVDLMEPEESANLLVPHALYAHDFVYGNVLVTRRSRGDDVDIAFMHWSENNGITTGRTEVAGGYMQFFHNTLLVESDFIDDYHTPILVNWAEQSDCPSTARPAVNDLRNNLVVLLSQTAGAGVLPWYWERCGDGNMQAGVNWLSVNPATQWWEPLALAPQTGAFAALSGGTTIAGSGDPFVDQANGNFRLKASASTALGAGQTLAPEVTTNVWGQDFTPVYQIVAAGLGGVTVEPRAQSGAGADLGAIER